MAAPLPFAIVDRDGRIERVSCVALRLIEECSHLGIREGLLRSTDKDEEATLKRVIACDGGACLAVAGMDDVPIIITGRAVESRTLLLFARVDEPHEKLCEALQSAFALTARESRIATALFRGCTLSDVARAMGIELSTARTHLKRVFVKTRTNRQVQLIRLLTTVSITLRSTDEIALFKETSTTCG